MSVNGVTPAPGQSKNPPAISHPQYEPYMLGNSPGFGVERQPRKPVAPQAPASQEVPETQAPAPAKAPQRQFVSAARTNVISGYRYKPTKGCVGECLYWPSALTSPTNAPGYGQTTHSNPQQRGAVSASRNQQPDQRNPQSEQRSAVADSKDPQTNQRNTGGDGDSPQFSEGPAKSVPSAPATQPPFIPQNLPFHVAPLGTDPNTMIKPLAPLTVKVQANLFGGDPNVPTTISIDPAQLYAAAMGQVANSQETPASE